MGSKKRVGHIEKFLKRADEILDDAVEFGEMATGQAKKTSKELRKRAKKEGEMLKKKGTEKINEGIVAAKSAATSAEEDLKTLEKLGKLKKSGILTEKEFQEKKKKILARI